MHPALPRLRHQLETISTPLVVMLGWPGSGRRHVIEGLVSALGARRVADGAALPADADPGWWLAEMVADDGWDQLARWARQGGHRVMAAPPALTLAEDQWPTTMTVLPAAALRLDMDELIAWQAAGPPIPASPAWLMAWTEGWLAPLAAYREALTHGDDDGVARLRAVTVTRARIDPDERSMLRLIALVPGEPLGAWRRAIGSAETELASTLRAALLRWFPGRRDGDRLQVPPVLGEAVLDDAGRIGVETWDEARILGALAQGTSATGDRLGVDRMARRTPAALRERVTWGTPTKPMIDVRLLGVSQIVAVGAGQASRSLRWRVRRALHVVAFLALARERRASRDALINALWPEADADRVQKNFHPTLSDARRMLRSGFADGARLEGIVHRQGSYGLDPAIAWRIDVDAFVRQVAVEPVPDARPTDGMLEGWIDAWHRYRGPLMADHDAPWLGRRRAELARDYRRLLRKIGAAHADRGQTTEAIDAYRTALLEDPFDEPVHRALMELYAAQGRRDLVLVQFLRLQDHLKELNVEPQAETQQCYDRLMRADVADTTTPSGGLRYRP